MPLMVGVIFKKNGNIYYYDPGELDIKIGDRVICHLGDTNEIGEIVSQPSEFAGGEASEKPSKIIRLATEYDLSVEELNKSKGIGRN